jgi:hypothetical protein
MQPDVMLASLSLHRLFKDCADLSHEQSESSRFHQLSSHYTSNQENESREGPLWVNRTHLSPCREWSEAADKADVLRLEDRFYPENGSRGTTAKGARIAKSRHSKLERLTVPESLDLVIPGMQKNRTVSMRGCQ